MNKCSIKILHTCCFLFSFLLFQTYIYYILVFKLLQSTLMTFHHFFKFWNPMIKDEEKHPRNYGNEWKHIITLTFYFISFCKFWFFIKSMMRYNRYYTYVHSMVKLGGCLIRFQLIIIYIQWRRGGRGVAMAP